MRYHMPIAATAASVARIGIVLTALFFLIVPSVRAQTTFTVNSTDDVDDGSCDGVHCSLREAITAANANVGADIIAFSIPGMGPHTIRPTSELPAIVDSVTIDGTTEPDFAGTPVIELDGSDAGMAHGLLIVGSHNTIRGLVINRFAFSTAYNGVEIGFQATGNVIEGNYIGTDVTGSIDYGNGNAGIMVGYGGNTIGGTTAEARNVISGNIEGVTVINSDVAGNHVIGNYIGTNASGDAGLPNNVGVLLLASGNNVGGTADGAGNVISGNIYSGIDMGPGVTGTVIEGNYIGTDATGLVALGNEKGVFVNEAPGNTIGGTMAGARNIISGNAGTAIDIAPGTTGTVIVGNYIGIDAAGTAALGNDIGVFVNDSPDNTIGGTTAGARNIISGNREGVTFWDPGATGNVVMGNYIGTNASGDAAVPNEFGIALYSPENTVGGSVEGAGNVISGNTYDGIKVEGPGATNNAIEGNYIGTDATGSVALGNEGIGVLVLDAPDNTIGGTTAGARNIISGNPEGLSIAASGATGNQVLGNYIGTNASGDAAIPNGVGVIVWDAPNNTIGGTTAEARNVISGNTDGVTIVEPGATANKVLGNYIGTNASGDAVVGNSTGVLLLTSSNIIGGAEDGAGNVISGNAMGINVNANVSDCQILGNYIGTDASGTGDLGNTDIGVFLWDEASNNLIGGIGGAESGARNVIAFNGAGVVLGLLSGTGNSIRSNSIFGNGGLGIDLRNDGVTENDAGDGDTGPNDLQNTPVLSLQPSDGDGIITASLNSIPSSTYIIEFFSNTECDDSGYGEGKTPLGTAILITDTSGDGSATLTVPGGFPLGTMFTATATDANGSTSEFSRCAGLGNFVVTIAPSSRTVAAGQSVSYTVRVNAEAGPFDAGVTLSCSGLPSEATCSFSDSTVVPGLGEARSVLTIETAARSKSLLSAGWQLPGNPMALALISLFFLAVLAAFTRSGKRGRRGIMGRAVAVRLFLFFLVVLLFLQVACGDDDTTAPTGGTPAGTYEFTVTGTWETVEDSATATLVVE